MKWLVFSFPTNLLLFSITYSDLLNSHYILYIYNYTIIYYIIYILYYIHPIYFNWTIQQVSPLSDLLVHSSTPPPPFSLEWLPLNIIPPSPSSWAEPQLCWTTFLCDPIPSEKIKKTVYMLSEFLPYINSLRFSFMIKNTYFWSL